MFTKAEVQKMLEEGKAYTKELCSEMSQPYTYCYQCHVLDVCYVAGAHTAKFVHHVYEKGTDKFLGILEELKD